MEAETRYADSDGVKIAYQVHGEGPLDPRFFRRLASFARLIMFDKREQGLSDRTGRPPTLEDSMDDLEAVLAAARPKRRPRWAIAAGASCWSATTPPSAANSPSTAGAR